MVTPDAQRTMATHLGVAGNVTAADIDPALVARAEITFIEGYLVGLPGAATAIEAAITAARAAGRRVALTLSDAGWVAAQRDAFGRLVDAVDIVVANEAEARELTAASDARAALAELAERCAVVAVTCSERGALISDGYGAIEVAAETGIDVVDTTGAGDLFAAGFLLGLARDLPPALSGRLGTLAAAEVIGHLGARPQQHLGGLAEAAGLVLHAERTG
jgi:sugar/nucleoside kinase (ribokinase family)